MDSPYLTKHNVERLAKDLAARNLTGTPIVLSMDCTVLRGRLLHCSEFGSHILGSVAPLEELEVKKRDDIDRIIQNTVKAKQLANQVRVLIGKVSVGGTRDKVHAQISGSVSLSSDSITRVPCYTTCSNSNTRQGHG